MGTVGMGCIVGLGEGAYHWLYQGRGGLSHCAGVWVHGSLVSMAEEAAPPTYWWCPYGQYSSEPCTSSPLQRKRTNKRIKHARQKRWRGFQKLQQCNSLDERGRNSKECGVMREIHSKLRSRSLTLGPFALTSGPEVEQCRALLQQGVGILHTDLIDIIHTELKLTCQLC